MLRTEIAGAVAVVAAALTMAGCTSSAHAEHESMQAMDSSGGMDHEHANFPPKEALPPTAPPVARPIDATAFQQAPCTLLAPEELRELNVGVPAKPSSRGKLRDCKWQDFGGPSKMNLMVTIYPGQGLQDIYGKQKNFGYLHVLPDIEGYPAVNAVPEDWRSMGFCGAAVGLSDRMYLNVNVALAAGPNPAPDIGNPCGRAQAVATAIMRHIKAANP